MGRHPREEGAGAIHHVIAKGSGGECIARDNVDRATLVEGLGRTTTRSRWLCLAYCLLDTHLHLVVTTPAANLGSGMQWFLARYAREFNKRHEREGNLFHTRFYSTRIRTDEHLISALVYVYLNPVRAGVVDRADAWKWSSFAATIGGGEASEFVAVDAALELIDPRPESARIRLELSLYETLEQERRARGVRHSV